MYHPALPHVYYLWPSPPSFSAWTVCSLNSKCSYSKSVKPQGQMDFNIDQKLLGTIVVQKVRKDWAYIDPTGYSSSSGHLDPQILWSTTFQKATWSVFFIQGRKVGGVSSSSSTAHLILCRFYSTLTLKWPKFGSDGMKHFKVGYANMHLVISS